MKNSFYSLIFRQKHILRWSLMRNTSPETLSEHGMETAVLAHALALIGNKFFSKNYNADRAASLALFHDATEVYTGDLPTPVKYFTPQMRSVFAEVENDAAKRLLSTLPEELRGEYESLLLPGEEDAAEVELVHAADKLAAYIKCLTERAGGNSDFSSAEKATKKALDAIDSPELGYFVDNIIPTFMLTIDEMQR